MYTKEPFDIFGLPWWLSGLRIRLQCRRPRFNPRVGKISWRREQLPTPVFWLGEFHGQRSLADYSPWGRKESDTIEQLSLSPNKLEMLKSAASDPNMNKSISEDKIVLLKELDLEPTNLSFQLFIAHIQGQLLSLKSRSSPVSRG